MLRLTLLGTAAALPARGNFNVAFTVQRGDVTWLVESGPHILYQLEAVNLDVCQIDGLFISHQHGDHALGFPLLVLALLLAGCERQLPVYCPAAAVEPLRELVRLAYPGRIFDALDDVCRFIPLPDDREQASVLDDNLTLSTRPTVHPVATLSLRLDWGGQAITYSADTAPLPALADFAADSAILIHEANYSATLDPDADLGHHSTARVAGEIAAAAGVQVLVLLHVHQQYVGQEHVLRAEAQASFGGDVLLPTGISTLVVT